MARRFLALPTLLVPALFALPHAAMAADCSDWNTEAFFRSTMVERVSTCIEAGTDPNAQDQSGVTPLHWAVKFSQSSEVVTTLIKAGADPNTPEKSGVTSLHAAGRFSKSPEVVTVLIEADANIRAQDTFDQTPLHKAGANNKNPEVVTVLLEAGADPTAEDNDGEKPGDLARNNEALRGTKVWWLLNDARFD